MKAPVTWTLALAISLAAHAGAAALVAAMLHPDPVPDQPPPRSELRIETQQVAQSRAAQEKPASAAAAAASAKGDAAAEGVVPLSKAVAETPAAQALAPAKAVTSVTRPAATQGAKLTAAPPPATTKAQSAPAEKLAAAPPPATTKAQPAPAEKLAAAPPPATTKAQAAPAEKLAAAAVPATLTPASPPVAPTLQASTSPAAKVQATAQTPDIVTAATAPAAVLAAVSTPAAVTKPVAPAPAPLAEARDTATALATTAPDSVPLAAAVPDLQLAAAAPSDGDHMTAALAWTGQDAQIDPTSLKAIQSFMQPGDTRAQADETHDALSAILTSVPCSRLQAEFNPATGSLDLRGHVPDPALKGPILKALQAQLGSGIKVNDAMLILPKPQCGALSGIADVGLPQSQDQNTNPRLIGADAQAKAYDYVTGQTIELDIGAPDYDAYIYVDYFDADGQVIHFIPNDSTALALGPAKSRRKVVLVAHGKPVHVGPPYGQEIATAFAASTPLYEGLRPLTEPAAPYLDWLKTRVAEARARDPGFKGEWVYFFVSTKDK